MSDLVEEYDPAGRLLWASPSVQTVLGWSPQEVVGRLVSELVHDEDDFDVDIQHPPIDGRSADNLEQRKRVRRLRADGSHVWVDSSLAFRFGEDGQHVGTYVTSRDIDAEVHAQAHLERSEQRFRMAMLSAPAGMALVSADDRLIQVNPALCRILGRSEQWLLGQLISELMDAEDADVDRAMRNQVLCGPEELATREHRMIRSDGQRIWVEHSIGLLRDTYGKPLSFVSQFIDVTETRRAREQLQFLATHDALTGLINRRELAARIGGLLAGPHPVGLATAVFFIDLDNFKQINDTLGHFAGDTVIATVARRLVEVVGQSDTVARIGGDEFVVVLCDLHGVAAAVRVADQIHDRVAMPVVTDGGEVAVTLSIGVAFVEDSDDFDAVLHRADTALYQAKQQGRAQTVIHHETGLSPSD
jgi:diguanylate cyclase (GGDEF)-like protein/PAS domain S-box-containing protein